MRIALDLDGVLYDFMKVAREVFPSIPKNPPKADVEEYLSPRQKEQFRVFVTSPQVYRNLPLIQGMKELIPLFNDNETHVVTARRKTIPGMERSTLESLGEIGLKPASIDFSSSKHKYVLGHDSDIYLEDQFKYVGPILQRDRNIMVLMPKVSYNADAIGQQIVRYEDSGHLRDLLTALRRVYE